MKKITKISNEQPSSKEKLRVAAYCRVSTSSAEQLDSLNAQREHYNTFIKNNNEWKFAGIFYDEGISGTKAKSRKGLYHLLDACENGRVDLVLTKSISRLVRNTTDCLSMVRRMMDLGVHIIFEKENIDTRSMESELMLSILAGLRKVNRGQYLKTTNGVQRSDLKTGHTSFHLHRMDMQIVTGRWKSFRKKLKW